MQLMRVRNAVGDQRAQMLIFVALSLPLLLLVVGFAIDFGCAFLTRAELAKASDAAALTIMHNLGQGQTIASQRGQSIFALNYNANSSLNALPPTLSPTYSVDTTTNEPVVNVVATATIKTFFISLAGFKTLTVSNTSQATRPPVILSIVLDRSGSMKYNGGAAALPGAVTNFLGYFIQGADRIGEVSFSSTANEDVAVTTYFQTPITNSMATMNFQGATFSYGGISDAQDEINSVTSPPPNAVPVVVFFTDGWANTNQDNLYCSGGTSGATTKINYGGCSPIEQPLWGCGFNFLNYQTGLGTSCSATVFPDQQTGTSVALTPYQSLTTLTNVSQDAMYRTVQLANSMRTAGITVYSIGLGNLIDQSFLYQVANDKSSSQFDPTKPVGEAVFAPSGADLKGAFQQIADKILLRLTQ
jgi:Flp pilus assembly protein TadG